MLRSMEATNALIDYYLSQLTLITLPFVNLISKFTICVCLIPYLIELSLDKKYNIRNIQSVGLSNINLKIVDYQFFISN